MKKNSILKKFHMKIIFFLFSLAESQSNGIYFCSVCLQKCIKADAVLCQSTFYFGAKLVRGAYMEQERARAETLGYVDPINPDFEATSAMYHSCLAECMRRMHELKQYGDGREKKVGIMVASHNADTLRFAISK